MSASSSPFTRAVRRFAHALTHAAIVPALAFTAATASRSSSTSSSASSSGMRRCAAYSTGTITSARLPTFASAVARRGRSVASAARISPSSAGPCVSANVAISASVKYCGTLHT